MSGKPLIAQSDSMQQHLPCCNGSIREPAEGQSQPTPSQRQRNQQKPSFHEENGTISKPPPLPEPPPTRKYCSCNSLKLFSASTGSRSSSANGTPLSKSVTTEGGAPPRAQISSFR